MILTLVFSLFSLASAELKTVDYVDLSQYAGTWYQIARKPVIFEAGCVCSRQVLTPREDGLIEVYNSCNANSPNGKLRDIRGTAENIDTKTNAKFKVDFNRGFKGDYWIIGLADDYSWAVVSDPRNVSLYILAKTPTLSDEQYADAVAAAAKQRDTDVLRLTQQNGCTYP